MAALALLSAKITFSSNSLSALLMGRFFGRARLLRINAGAGLAEDFLLKISDTAIAASCAACHAAGFLSS